MVEEILDTRLMVKRCMSRYKSDKGLHKLLHARQLGLKLIANVTFGYAAANFSGRMPCVEVGVETKINIESKHIVLVISIVKHSHFPVSVN